MLNARNPHENKLIDEAIAGAVSQLDSVPAYSDEYNKMVIQIEKLYALRYTNSAPRVSPDTLAIVLGNLAGILIIVGYESTNAMTSKAINFVMKATR